MKLIKRLCVLVVGFFLCVLAVHVLLFACGVLSGLWKRLFG